LISEFRLLNTVFIEYLTAKCLRDGSDRGTEYERQSGEKEDERVTSRKSCSQTPRCISSRDPAMQEMPVTWSNRALEQSRLHCLAFCYR